MKDIECPYCEEEQDINHDDGYGYEEGVLFQYECHNCGKAFVFTTSISFHYDAIKADCLNGEPHDFQPTHTYPIEYTMMECTGCGERRKPTQEEMEDINSRKDKMS